MGAPLRNVPLRNGIAMKAKDVGKEADWSAEGPARFAPLAAYFTDRYVAEPKLDGVRIRLEFGAERTRVITGQDRTANFPHLARLAHPQLAGMVLDGELVAGSARMTGFGGTAIDSLLTASVSLVNCLPAASIRLQRQYGVAQVHLFDMVAGPGGQPTTSLDYDTRRKLLAQAVETVVGVFGTDAVHLVPQLPASAQAVDQALADGFEGVVLKRRASRYVPGGRGDWLKIKNRSTADGYVIGFEPGKDGRSGEVGSLLLAVRRADGSEWHVASVGNLTVDFRREVTGPDGALRPEWYGRVIEFAAQGLTAGVKARHPFMLRLRPDKSAADCGEEQLRVFPRV